MILCSTLTYNRGVVGEQLSGPLSDFVRNRRLQRDPRHQTPVPERRLWFAYPSYMLCIVGFVFFLVTLDNALPNQWTVSPVVGLAICAAGNQMQTTALFTCELIFEMEAWLAN